MGVELVIPLQGPCPLAPVLDRLAAAGQPCAVLMIDRQLWPPGRPLPEVWSDVRLKTPAGMVTLASRPNGIAVVAFGNAGEELRAVQAAIAAALSGAG
jgi:hypothetical protein